MQLIRIIPLAVVILTGALIPTHAQVVVYNTFGPGNSYSSTDWGVTGASTSGGYRGQAQAFTPGISGDLSSIELATAHINGSALSDFFIAQDNGSGAPGTILESFSSTQNAANGLLVLNSVVQPLLQAGTQYWLCDEPSTSTSLNGWYENNQGQMGFAFERTEWGWSAVSNGPPGGVFEVSVMPVPEPAVGALGVIGGLGLLWTGWRRKRRSMEAI